MCVCVLEARHASDVERRRNRKGPTKITKSYLQQLPAKGQRLRAVEEPDVVKTKKTATEEILSVGVLSVHPPPHGCGWANMMGQIRACMDGAVRDVMS